MCTNNFEEGSSPSQKYIHFFKVNRDVELGLVQSGHHITKPGYKYGPMIRDHYLIHFIKSGKGKLYLNKMVYDITEGNCFLIYPHQIAFYQADNTEPWEYCWIGFCGFNAESVLDAIGFSYNCNIVPFKSDKICKTIDLVTNEGFKYKNDEMAIYLHLGALVRKVLYYLWNDNRKSSKDNYIKPTKDSSDIMGKGKYADEYVNIVSKIIHNSYAEGIRVEMIAEKLNINRSYLSASFKKHTGLSIKEYITRYRIEKSRVLLHNKSMLVSEISNAVGFDDPLYFSRIFKKYIGCSPSDYRDRL